MTGPLPDLSTSMNIIGTEAGVGNTVLRGNTGGDYRIFAVTGGSTVGIENLTISNGFANANSFPDNRGGGIFNNGHLTVTDSTLNGNRAGSSGGGIYTQVHSGETSATVTGSTVTNATIAGNSTGASGAGGGIANLTDTVFGRYPSTATLRNTLVALNTSPDGPDLVGRSDFGGPLTSAGNNLIGNADGSEGFTNGDNGDQVGSGANPIDPKLRTGFTGKPILADDGGPTQTIALLLGSPAIDAGSDGVLGSPSNLTTDQRGADFPRKRGAHVDVGGFEVQNQPPQATDDSASVERGVAKTLAVLSNDQDPDGDALSVASISDPSHGTVTINPDNTVRFAPQASYTGADSFTYTVSDGNGATDTATVNLAVTDSVRPTVSRVVPTENLTGVAPGINIYAFFSEKMSAASIKSTTFKLYEKGSTKKIPADVTLDPSNSKKAILDPKTALPKGHLKRGVTYRAVVSTGAKDVAGNQLTKSKVWFFTVKP